MPQEHLHDVLAIIPRRKTDRFSIQRVRCRAALEQEARRFEVASVDGEHEREAAARVQQETHQGRRSVRGGYAQRIAALKIWVGTQREQRSDSVGVAALHRLAQRRSRL